MKEVKYFKNILSVNKYDYLDIWLDDKISTSPANAA